MAVNQWKMDFLCPYADILVQARGSWPAGWDPSPTYRILLTRSARTSSSTWPTYYFSYYLLLPSDQAVIVMAVVALVEAAAATAAAAADGPLLLN